VCGIRVGPPLDQTSKEKQSVTGTLSSLLAHGLPPLGSTTPSLQRISAWSPPRETRDFIITGLTRPGLALARLRTHFQQLLTAPGCTHLLHPHPGHHACDRSPAARPFAFACLSNTT
jgi:hypothetical protein